jgi:hypothetical protein
MWCTRENPEDVCRAGDATWGLGMFYILGSSIPKYVHSGEIYPLLTWQWKVLLCRVYGAVQILPCGECHSRDPSKGHNRAQARAAAWIVSSKDGVLVETDREQALNYVTVRAQNLSARIGPQT